MKTSIDIIILIHSKQLCFTNLLGYTLLIMGDTRTLMCEQWQLSIVSEVCEISHYKIYVRFLFDACSSYVLIISNSVTIQISFIARCGTFHFRYIFTRTHTHKCAFVYIICTIDLQCLIGFLAFVRTLSWCCSIQQQTTGTILSWPCHGHNDKRCGFRWYITSWNS